MTRRTTNKNITIDTSTTEELFSEGRRPKENNSSVASHEKPGQTNQVKAKQKTARRKFSTADKVRILAAYEACDNSLARGELLRKEGLYYSRLSAWRAQRDAGRWDKPKKSKQHSSEKQQLKREVDSLKKKLTQAQAIIDLQKKVSELLGQHILEPKSNE